MKKTISVILALILLLGLAACGAPKQESLPSVDVEAPTATATRKDLEDALAYSALAYYLKDTKMQYCGRDFNQDFSKYWGSDYRVTEFASPEYGTAEQTIYSVCSAYVLQLYYEAIGKRLFNNENYVDCNTNSLWQFCETQPEGRVQEEGNTDMCLLRCWVDYELSASDIKYGVTDKHKKTVEETRQFLADWKTNLRPGDVLVAEGHALVYVGNGFVLDVGGASYNVDTGREPFEYEGAVAYLHTIEDLFLEGGDYTTGDFYLIDENFSIDDNDDGKLDRDSDGPFWFTVIRPLQAYVIDDGDGDPSNDLAKDGAPMKAAAYSRMAYPGIEIDRGIEGITPFSTLCTGQEITYRVKVTNYSNEDAVVRFETARNASYAPAAYQGIRVTETIPAGTELVSASNGAIVSGNTIAWIMDDIAPGETGVVSYTVKVTAKQGETVYAEGGFVSHIPTPALKNLVGGTKLSETAVQSLAKFAQLTPDQWREEYNISATAPGMEFAERVYAKTMGIALDLPEISEILDNIYQWKVQKLASRSVRYTTEKLTKVYTMREEVKEEYRSVADMLALGYHGGARLYYEDVTQNINEFKLRYLEPGDILVYANTDDNANLTDHRVMVYAGEDTIVSLEQDGRATAIRGADAEKLLYRAFIQDVFFMLRPTLAAENLNESTYDAAKEPAYGEEPAANAAPAPLSDANKQAISALTVDDVSSLGRNTAFAEKVYQKIGLDFKEITKSLTQVNVMAKLCGKTKIGTINHFELIFENPNHVSKMLLPEYLGGIRVLGEGRVTPTLADLEIGDVLNFGNNAKGCYWVGIYQGEGKLLTACWDGKGTDNYYQVLTLTDASLADLWQKHPTNDTEWLWAYILRPSLAYADINTEAAM